MAGVLEQTKFCHSPCNAILTPEKTNCEHKARELQSELELRFSPGQTHNVCPGGATTPIADLWQQL